MPDAFSAQNVIEMMPAYRSYVRILALALILRPQASNSQNATTGSEASRSEATPSAIDTTGCEVIPGGKTELRPLSKVCQFALTYRHSLPDFVCKQTTTNTGPHSTTVFEAEVRFENGEEHYSKVSITSSKGPKENSSTEFISAGELGSDLVNLFETPTAVTFRVPKEARLRDISSSIYQFHVAAKKNAFWILRDNRGVSLNPEYEGALWLERDNGQLLRLELRSVDLPRDFGFATVHVTIDYRQTPLGDLGKFLLPSTSTTTVCHWDLGSCTKSVLVFHDYHKFSSKTRILIANPQH